MLYIGVVFLLAVIIVVCIKQNFRVWVFEKIKKVVSLMYYDKIRIIPILLIMVICLNVYLKSMYFLYIIVCWFIIQNLMLKYHDKWKIRTGMYYGYYILFAFVVFVVAVFLNAKCNFIEYDIFNLILMKLGIWIPLYQFKDFFIKQYGVIEKIKKKSNFINMYTFIIALMAFDMSFLGVYFQSELIVDTLNQLLISFGFVIFIIIEGVVSLNFLPLMYKDLTEAINISILNLDAFDIISNAFYTQWQVHGINNPEGGRFFKIDFKHFLPQHIESCETQVLNHLHMFMFKESKKKDYFYFYVENVDEQKTIILKILFDYRLNGKRKKEVLDLCLLFTRYEDEIVCKKIKILNYYRARLTINHLKLSNPLKEDIDFCSLLNKLYQYDKLDMFTKSVNEMKPTDTRKWMVHRGGFGSGKSALDCLTLYEKGMVPVVISPWEENSNDDFLFLVFEHLSKSTGIKIIYPTMTVLFFFLAELFGVGIFLKNIFDYVLGILGDLNVFNSIHMFASVLLGNIGYPLYAVYEFLVTNYDSLYGLLIWGFALIVSLWFTLVTLPYLVIYMKDSTMVHQAYYIKGIYKMLKNSESVLVIEDIDRFDKERVEQLYRLASAINRACYHLTRPVGLISYQIDIASNNQNQENANLDNEYLKKLENKVVYMDYLKDYSEQESKKKYFSMCVKAILLYKTLSKGEKIELMEKNSAQIDEELSQMFKETYQKLQDVSIKCNFREVKEHVHTIYQINLETINELDLEVSKYILEEMIEKDNEMTKLQEEQSKTYNELNINIKSDNADEELSDAIKKYFAKK